jgi:hypothetical protein
MTLKGKRNVTLGRDANSIQPHAEDTSANHAPNHEEIRGRAYEIYLERSGLPGDELDDWLRADRELQRLLFSNEAGIVFRTSTTPTPRTESDIQRRETMERRIQ